VVYFWLEEKGWFKKRYLLAVEDVHKKPKSSIIERDTFSF